jgi:hypothetical protein
MRSLWCLAFVTSVLSAQTQDIYISNANVQFGVEFNSTPFVYVAGADYLRASPTGDPAGVLFKTAWAYRLNSDVQEFIFNDGNGQATFLNAGPIGFATWNNVDNRGLIAANLSYLALSTGPSSGAVVARMQITNISNQPVTLNLFHLADIDDCGVNYGTNVATAGSTGHQYHTGSCGETADHFAAGADRWEAGSYTGTPAGNVDLYTRLEDSLLYNLANTPGSVGPFDIRGAFQWQDRVIRPGKSETYTIALTHNTTGQAYGFTHYGIARGGSLGLPELNSIGDAALGTTMTATVTNCPPNALSVLVMGFTKSNTPIADLFNYIGAPNYNFVLVANGLGSAQLPIAIPASSGLINVNLMGEGFVFDSTTTSTSGFPLTHTTGAHWVLGVY